ncbi:MAG TPA: BTAD domain-containing putative transcriptional regulator [Pseudonocardiaceae bacterium]
MPQPHPGSLNFRVLGPVECTVGDRVVSIGHPRQRCVLAVLLIEVNRSVHAEQLIDRVWGDEPPTNVRNVLSSYITRLRGVVKDACADTEVVIARRSGGYGVSMDPDRIDLHRFRDLVVRARTFDDAGAAPLLREALALWQGLAFADVDSAWLANLRHTLAHERLQAHLWRNDIALGAGQHAELLSELHDLSAEHPLDEHIVMQFMLALYRCGRQADALIACAQAKSRLVTELGLDAGPELRELEQRILRNDTTLAARRASVHAPVTPQPPLSVPRQLPAGTADFTGRERELSELDSVLTVETELGAPAVVISALDGTAGVGKTALAVHWAHRTKQRFPDGQLFVNLRGHALGAPTDPLRVLGQFLRALGTPPEQVPVDPDEAAAMYRTALADRRALVVLDNAWGPEQVRPLLPGSASCAVLITSRNQLSGLVARDGARQLTVGVLTDDAARELVTRIIGTPRVAAEPDAVTDLLRLCSHLPLALRIAAAKLANSPGQRIADLVSRLRQDDRLDLLQMEDDPEAVVRSAFHLSYSSLDQSAQRLFRWLGAVPGPSFSAAVVAAMIDRPFADAAGLLKTLSAAHLVEGEDDRYWCHDLLRLFARERLADEESDAGRAAVLASLHDFYLRSAAAAGDVLYPQMLRLSGTSSDGRTFADHNEALAWLDGERANLFAVIAHAADDGPHPVAWRLADLLRGYFWLRRCTAEWLSAAGDALRAAQADGDQMAQASAWMSSAMAHWTVSSLTKAVDHYQQALRLAGEIGWVEGQAGLLGNLAGVYLERGELDRAESSYKQALELSTKFGRQVARAMALSNLGNLYCELGSLRQAAAHFAEALAVYDVVDAPMAKANALLNLGTVQHDMGAMATALDTLGAGLVLCRELGDSSAEATALETIARVRLDSGDLSEALASGQAALMTAQRIGTRRIEAAVLTTLGSVHNGLGHPQDAIKHHQRALDLGRAIEDQRAITEALTGLASTQLGIGGHVVALAHIDEALRVSRAAGYRLLTSRALTVRAAIQLHLGEKSAAGECAREALGLQVDAGDRLWEARTRDVLSQVYDGLGDSSAADRYRHEAHRLFERIGVPAQRI